MFRKLMTAAAITVCSVAAISSQNVASGSTVAKTSTVDKATTVSSSYGDPVAGTVLNLPGGKTAKLPKNFSDMTVTDMAKIGIVPNMGGGGSSKSSFQKASRISPANAEGSDGDVIIYLFGSGTRLDNWETHALWRGGAGTTFAAYWCGYNTICQTGSNVYPTAPGWLYGYRSDLPGIFPSGMQLCSTWISVSGKPCEVIG